MKKAIRQKTTTKVGCVTYEYRSGMLFAHLPSGRRLSYAKPEIGANRFGGESITYMGLDGAKHWNRIETFGGKLVENLVQAISRDILCFSIRTISHYRIVAHVHDELIIEAGTDVSVESICEQMSRTPPWLPGLELRADGYECIFYQKK